MIKIGYGIADLKTMVDRNLYYVDRTEYLEILEGFSSSYIAYMRPRRFGKSMWISVLDYYYNVKHSASFDYLFGKYNVGKKPTPFANAYLILRFNFSGVTTETDDILRESFLVAVIEGLKLFFKNYPKNISKEARIAILSEKSPANMLRSFFDSVTTERHKVYLLIDEYDHFANELMAFRFNTFQNVVTKDGWVRKFYEVFKNKANDGTIQRLFITGVSPVTLDSLTSGFNICENLSMDLDLHSLMGFTHQEVTNILKGIDVDENKLPEIMTVLKDWYDGYLFNPESAERLYNSDMVLYFAGQFSRYNRPPRKMLDTNVATDYGKIRNIFRIGSIEEKRWEYMDKLMRDEPVRIQITDIFNFEKGFLTEDFLSLLFYMGFLTIKEESFDNSVFLKMPNRVIGNLYRDYFIRIMAERSGLGYDMIDFQEALYVLTEDNNPRPLLAILCNTLTALTLRDFGKMDEKHVQAMFFCYVNLTQVYDTTSEYQSQKQFYDILMLKNGLANEKVVHEFLFEFKYAKKATEDRLGKIDNEAVEQVERYLTHKCVQNHPNLHAWRIVIVGDKLEICEEVPRKL